MLERFVQCQALYLRHVGQSHSLRQSIDYPRVDQISQRQLLEFCRWSHRHCLVDLLSRWRSLRLCLILGICFDRCGGGTGMAALMLMNRADKLMWHYGQRRRASVGRLEGADGGDGRGGVGELPPQGGRTSAEVLEHDEGLNGCTTAEEMGRYEGKTHKGCASTANGRSRREWSYK